ncbi:ComF family protein [Candidatus Parcubacteria bacterium]|nr:MAG: ComF family protein [Candidatus Parcubacteria bacterium]
MLRFLNILLDAILPRRERTKHTSERTAADIPLFPATHTLLGTEIVTILNYREPAVRELLQSLKYDASGHAAQLCVALLEDYVREEISAKHMFSTQPVVLIPVPLHKNRLRERGFNQIEKILEHLSEEFHDGTASRIDSQALIRVRSTKQQTHLSRRERLENVANAFTLTEHHGLKDAHVLLLDDVTTTGATLVEASKPFLEVGIPVSLIALARA